MTEKLADKNSIFVVPYIYTTLDIIKGGGDLVVGQYYGGKSSLQHTDSDTYRLHRRVVGEWNLRG